MAPYFPVHADLRIALTNVGPRDEHAGMFVLTRPSLHTDTADLFEYDRVHEYVSIKSDKVVIAPIVNLPKLGSGS